MKTVLFVGNGLNKLLANLVRNYPLDKAPKDLKENLNIISDTIDDIAGLWARFKHAFPRIKQAHPNLCDEQIFSLLCELSNEEIFKEIIPIDRITELNNRIDSARKESLKEIVLDFKRFENLSGNRTIRRLFPSFGIAFENMLNSNKVEDIFICTTNYDGILDTLLTHPIRNNGTNFIFPDGFGKSNIPGHLKLYENNLKDMKRGMVHLHGSYKFARKGKSTFKVTGDIKNDEPVLVFNNPFLKKNEILEDQVLSVYYKTLMNKLKEYDRVIIIGNSFKNEPHIKDLISRYFDRQNTELIVCSLNPNEVVKELRDYYSKEIYQFSTKGVNSEHEFLKILNQLFTPNISNSNLCKTSIGLVA